MKSAWLLPLVCLPLLALAADAAKKDTHRTTKLGVCSKEAHAKGLKGDERKKYISSCIASAKAAKSATPRRGRALTQCRGGSAPQVQSHGLILHQAAPGPGAARGGRPGAARPSGLATCA